jgi:hypothetical protein
VYKGFARINEISALTSDLCFSIEQSSWANDKEYIFRINTNDAAKAIITKMEENIVTLSSCSEFSLGITPYDKYRGHTIDQIKNRVFHASFQKDETYKRLLAGNDVRRYFAKWNGGEWISYGTWLGAARESKFFKQKRIIVKQIIDWSSKRIWAALSEEELYNTQNAFNIIPNKEFLPEYLLALLNSNLITFYHRKKFLEEFKDRFQKILIKDCKEFPVKSITIDRQQLFVSRVNTMRSKSKELQDIKFNFQQLLLNKYDGLKISKRLEDWPSHTFKEFLTELTKQKVKLSLSGETDWIKYYEEQKNLVNSIQEIINNADREIDKMVYELYQLNEDEIKTVESI